DLIFDFKNARPAAKSGSADGAFSAPAMPSGLALCRSGVVIVDNVVCLSARGKREGAGKKTQSAL
ncbi:MAG: hypothetical protein ACPG7D_08355, partial [Candidatus Puniceispirillaceae bacterium]